MKMIVIENAMKNPVILKDLTRIAPGKSAEVAARFVSTKLIERGLLKVVEGAVDADESDAPDEGDKALTIDEMAARLVAEPDLIPADGFIASGAPEVSALEEIFGQNLSAAIRDKIWAKVQERNGGSN